MTLWNQIAQTYDDLYSDPRSEAENEVLFRDLARWPQFRRRVLDLGCGTGLYLDHIRPHQYVGIDASSEMIRVAQRRHKTRPDSAMFYSMDYKDASEREWLCQAFTGVVCLFGSGNYGDPQEVTDLVQMALRPGGRYYLMFYSWRYAFRRSYPFFGKQPFVPHTPATLRPVAEALGGRLSVFRIWGTRHPAILRLQQALPGPLAPWLADYFVISGEL